MLINYMDGYGLRKRYEWRKKACAIERERVSLH